jgi:hypothetical protein
MSAQWAMILLPIAVFAVGLAAIGMAYVSSVRTPVEAQPAQPDLTYIKRLSEQLDRLMQSSRAEPPPRAARPRQPSVEEERLGEKSSV